MKKFCIYIPFFILFLNTTYLSQLFKLPVLVAHFIEHRELDNKIGIIDFLSMHYWGDDMNDNDQDRDMQLPFKKIEANSCFQVITPLTRVVLDKQQAYTMKVFQPIVQDADLSDPALSSLFRPPRV